MSTREELMNKLAEEHFKKATPFMTDKEREHYLEDHSRSQTLTAFHAGQKAADAHPDQSLLAENARLRDLLNEARQKIEGTLTYDPMIDKYKLKVEFRDRLKPFLEVLKTLSQSPAEEYVRLSDVMPLVEAAEDVSCECTIQERLSGHRVACGMPALQEALAAFEKARGK